ncbi:MAG: hypothetical protein J3K34DRAFT_419916 [Monoraphidium minutum]|nr:MAG: hypothetical protein J3K34DRAFT_419916 [Monoraphidium minutum]
MSCQPPPLAPATLRPRDGAISLSGRSLPPPQPPGPPGRRPPFLGRHPRVRGMSHLPRRPESKAPAPCACLVLQARPATGARGRRRRQQLPPPRCARLSGPPRRRTGARGRQMGAPAGSAPPTHWSLFCLSAQALPPPLLSGGRAGPSVAPHQPPPAPHAPFPFLHRATQTAPAPARARPHAHGPCATGRQDSTCASRSPIPPPLSHATRRQT